MGKEGKEFSFQTALCIKLLASLVDRAQMLLFLLPEARRLKRLCAGWLASLIIIVTFLVRWALYVSCREGSEPPMISTAVFTMHRRVSCFGQCNSHPTQ